MSRGWMQMWIPYLLTGCKQTPGSLVFMDRVMERLSRRHLKKKMWSQLASKEKVLAWIN